MAESEEELKILLMKVKKEIEKAGLKVNIQKIKIIASGSMTSWQIGGKKVEAVADFIEVSGFLELSCFFNDPMDVGNLISGSSAFPKSSLNIWSFMVHVLLKPGLENFVHYFASMWDVCIIHISCIQILPLPKTQPDLRHYLRLNQSHIHGE